MVHIIEQTDEEKYKMYKKLSKDELIKMLIEANKHLQKPFYNASNLTIGDLCSCNPANGGSGICGCTIANNLVDYGNVEFKTNFSISSCSCERGVKIIGEYYCSECLKENPLLCT